MFKKNIYIRSEDSVTLIIICKAININSLLSHSRQASLRFRKNMPTQAQYTADYQKIVQNNEPAVTHKQKRILHIPTNTSAIGISDDEQQRHNLHVSIEGLFVHRIFRENSVILNRFINSHC